MTDFASIRFHNEEEIIAASGDPDPDAAYMRLIHAEKTRLQLEYVRTRNLIVDVHLIRDTLVTLVRTRTAASDGASRNPESRRAATVEARP